MAKKKASKADAAPKSAKAEKKPAAAKATPVTATNHADSRPNIPTRELGALVDAAETKSVLYPRDPSLDPQLVWRGKDDQDAAPLEIPAVPIYIQEKIHPQALIEDLRRRTGPKGFDEPDLFADFNGLDPNKRTEFYQHPQHWTNRLILGDSLYVMASLAQRENLRGQVQCIYFDPPYGIKFGSNWQVSTRKRDVKDGKEEDLARQPEQIKAFRDTWELGIHSYLAYLRDRLVAARDLLTESGSIFVQIGDENVHLVRCLMDEVMGAENFCGLIQVQKTGGQSSGLLSSTVDFLLWYAKNKTTVKYRQLYLNRGIGETSLERYDYVELADGSSRRLTGGEMARTIAPPDGKLFRSTSLISSGPSATDQRFPFGGKNYVAKSDSHWKTTLPGLSRLGFASRIIEGNKTIFYKRYLDDFPVVPIHDRWESLQIGMELAYVVQTSNKVIERCLLMTTDPGDLVLDPTCGSGTTAYVAEQWGRRWITTDTSRVALALARARLMGAKLPYYLMAGSPAGKAKAAELAGERKPPLADDRYQGDIRQGFVYKTVPHVT